MPSLGFGRSQASVLLVVARCRVPSREALSSLTVCFCIAVWVEKPCFETLRVSVGPGNPRVLAEWEFTVSLQGLLHGGHGGSGGGRCRHSRRPFSQDLTILTMPGGLHGQK